jgi:hypothetical protein
MTIKKIYYKTHWGVNVINQGFCFCIINRQELEVEECWNLAMHMICFPWHNFDVRKWPYQP